jgi:RNA-directed DNA polymerase
VMHGHGKSDNAVVPTKPLNNAVTAAAEVVEERALIEENMISKTLSGHSAGPRETTALDRVRRLAQQDKELQFTALLHHINPDSLKAAYRALNPKAAKGIDGVDWKDYGNDLDANIEDLHRRIHTGAYRPSPTRRAFIPKATGQVRPLGIITLEDKIAQRATAEVMNAIYEQDFVGFSYAFRPGRSQHMCLDALSVGLQRKNVNYVLSADITSYFDRVDHELLMDVLERRIGDKRLLRLLNKWLEAGVMQDGELFKTVVGTPQGATISPLLANVFLHYALDTWTTWWRRNKATGDMVVVRFADDVVVGFQHERDARQFQEDLGKRLETYKLELSEEKTKLIEFGRYAARKRRGKGQPKPETFDFLGFTHICAENKKGKFWVKRITIKKRMRDKLKAVKAEMKIRRHQSVPEQARWLASVLRGYCAYYGVPGNMDAVQAFRDEVVKLWHKSLKKRSQKHRLDWQRMNRIAKRHLPKLQATHPFPNVRFDAIHPR